METLISVWTSGSSYMVNVSQNISMGFKF